MPITFKVADHESEPFKRPISAVETPAGVLKVIWERSTYDYGAKLRTTKSCKDLIQSSLQPGESLSNLSPRSNGFVQAVVTAYNEHHNLVIRPDDVWIAILSQFYLYVDANAEALRSKFVSHEGKETIVVDANAPTRYHVNYDWMAKEMTKQLKRKIVDPDLVDFIVPNFSTTTPVDTAVGCVMMMGTLKHYFDYRCNLTCGIPEVTVLGTKEDYEDILHRLDKFDEFGKEPTVFAALLRPIIRELVEVFNVNSRDPNAAQNTDFWSRICHYKRMGSGPDSISGWVTAFCVWNNDGKWQGPNLYAFSKPISDEERIAAATSGGNRSHPLLFLDNARYPSIETAKIPNGFCEVDVVVDEFGAEYNCVMVAGHVGFTISGERSDTLQPSPQWFMFEKEEVQEKLNMFGF